VRGFSGPTNYFGSKKFPKRVLADLCNVKKTDGWLFGRI
jgi:hypothetical protein